MMIGPVIAHAVPEERLAIVRILRTIHVRRAQRDDRKPIALMQAEQCPLAHRLVADVGIGMVVRRERVAFMMVQTVTIGGNARHVYVALQPVAACAGSRLHLGGRGSAMPVVDVVENDVELLPDQGRLQEPECRCDRR